MKQIFLKLISSTTLFCGETTGGVPKRRLFSHAGSTSPTVFSWNSIYYVLPSCDKLTSSTAFPFYQGHCTVPQMIPRPQMIPKMDRKWSSTASDPQSWPQMIPWKLAEWNGFYGTDYKKGLIIKKGTFFSHLLKKKGRRMLHLRSIYTRRKKK